MPWLFEWIDVITMHLPPFIILGGTDYQGTDGEIEIPMFYPAGASESWAGIEHRGTHVIQQALRA
jgi:hypothetical protein